MGSCRTSSKLRPYIWATLITAVVAIIRLLLRPLLNTDLPFLFFIFAPLISSWVGGLGPGLWATFLSAGLATYSFFMPSSEYVSRDIATSLRITVFLIFGSFNSYLIASLQKNRLRSEQSQAALLESEERFRSVFAHAAVGMAINDLQGRFVQVNAAYCSLVGYSEDELLKMSYGDVAHPDERDSNVQAVREVIAAKTWGKVLEKRYSRKSGETVWVQLTLSIQRDQLGNPLRIIIIAEDISEKKRAAEALRDQMSILQTITDNTVSCLFMMDKKGHPTFMNPAAERVTGYTLDEISDKPLHHAIHHHRPDNRCYPMDECPIHRAQVDFVSRQNEEEIFIRKDGSYFPVSFSVSPLKDGGGGVVGSILEFRDITKEKKANEVLRTALTRAEEATLAKSQFLANMSHEIRTPMNAILGFSDLLMGEHLTEEQHNFISRIKANGDQLLHLINDILDLSKVESGQVPMERVRFSFQELISELFKSMSVLAEKKGIRTKLTFVNSIPQVIESDPMRLRQILTNLISNAVKFTEQGTVELRVEFQDRSENSPHPDLVVQIIDSGIGIASDVQNNLFQPFFQADSSITRRFGGTGLGLALSKHLAEALGGRLELVSSSPGKGSRFRLSVPTGDISRTMFVASPRLLAGKQLAQADRGEMRLAQLKVLLVEDSSDNELLMKIYLDREGAVVDVAHNGVEAIDKASHDNFDVVLMDIQMPLLDGLEATQRLRRQGYSRPIIALTAHALREEVDRSLNAGCTAHLSKPVDSDNLIKTILSCAQRSKDMGASQPMLTL